MLKTEAVRNFLNAKAPIDLATMFTPNMECQVNTAQDNGERVEGEYDGHRWCAWSDGQQRWKSFRIPFHANTVPEYIDKGLTWNLEEHAEGIGSTGWDWVNRVSKWVAFDFDAIVGHSKGITDDALAKVQDEATKLPWVTVRRSTSGNGLHLYVFVDNVPTANHTEHAALARAILGKMASLTGFDFNNHVDCVGGNIWLWHRKYEKVGGRSGPGLKLIKQGDVLTDIPINWKDHVAVTSGKKKRITPGFVPTDAVDSFEEFCGQNQRTPLDEGHLALIKWLEEHAQGSAWWNQDLYLLVCHTYDLKCAHAALGMKGVFDTVSTGREAGDQNAWCCPGKRGSWTVRRHSKGIEETATWDQDNSGWTRCYLNREPDIAIAARVFGGGELERGGFKFDNLDKAIKAAEVLGSGITVPDLSKGNAATLKTHKDGRLMLQMDVPGSSEALAELRTLGWVEDKKRMSIIFGSKVGVSEELDIESHDDTLRHLVSEAHDNCGWVARSSGAWVKEPIEHLKMILLSQGNKSAMVPVILGNCATKYWTLVNRPFQPEYPGDRLWNRDAAQFAYPPNPDKDSLNFPTWKMVLNHIGKSLDNAIKEQPWCRDNGVNTGGTYLTLWVASMFQRPYTPLPYLFLYGPQGSGKSILHEALSSLMTAGVMRADQALISQGGFNAELETAILCIVEELDLRQNKSNAYNRVKDYVTSLDISLHKKGKTPYMVANTTKWIQCGNDIEFCPVFPGDTRITVIHVPVPEEIIPKHELLTRLKKEAPDFLAHVLGIELPDSRDRLGLPIVETADKIKASEVNMTEVDLFLDEVCHEAPGHVIKYSVLYDRFKEWIDPAKSGQWSMIQFGRKLPQKFPKGRVKQAAGDWYIGNISFEQQTDTRKRWTTTGIGNNTYLIQE